MWDPANSLCSFATMLRDVCSVFYIIKNFNILWQGRRKMVSWRKLNDKITGHKANTTDHSKTKIWHQVIFIDGLSYQRKEPTNKGYWYYAKSAKCAKEIYVECLFQALIWESRIIVYFYLVFRWHQKASHYQTRVTFPCYACFDFIRIQFHRIIKFKNKIEFKLSRKPQEFGHFNSWWNQDTLSPTKDVGR